MFVLSQFKYYERYAGFISASALLQQNMKQVANDRFYFIILKDPETSSG